MVDINTEVALLKKEVSDIKFIFNRLDTAIEKITEVTTSVNRMLAVHEEKISQQEEALAKADFELSSNIKELHSRITTNSKEIMAAASAQHIQQNKEIQKIKDELVARVGVLEKWRHVLIGGSIVIGFILHKFINFST